MSTGFNYRPGTGAFICGDDLAILAGIAPDGPIAQQLLELVGNEAAGVDEALEVLVAPGLWAIADFAIMQVGKDSTRIVLRGDCRATAEGAEPLVGSRMWYYHSLPAGPQLTISLGAAAGAQEPWLPLMRGVALASEMRPFAEVSERAEQPPTAASAPVKQTAEPEVTPKDEPAPQPAATTPEPEPKPAPEPAEAAPESIEDNGSQSPLEQADEFDYLFDVGLTRSTIVAPQPEDEEPAAPEPSKPAKVSGHTMPSTQTAVLEAGDVPPPVPAPPSIPDSAIETGPPSRPGFISGLPWEPAAPDEPAPEPIARRAEPSVPPVATPPPAQPQPMPAQPIPPQPMPPQPAPQPPAPQPQVAAVDRTVARGNLHRGGAVMVMATRCPQGHLGAAHASSCRVCGQGIPPQNPISIPRPPLGRLRLSNGGVVPLDRGVILGRNPHVPGGFVGEQPNLVQLPDPDKDISSQHLEVRLDDWHVAVRDLGSTNGTEVQLPGEASQLLRANDPMVITPGTKVVLAGVFSFVFEVA